MIGRFTDWVMDLPFVLSLIVVLGTITAILFACAGVAALLFPSIMQEPYCRPGEALVWMQHVRAGKIWVYKDPWCIKPQGRQADYK